MKGKYVEKFGIEYVYLVIDLLKRDVCTSVTFMNPLFVN